MSYLFDGVDDQVNFTPITTGDARSMLAWILPNTQGEGDEGRILSHGTGDKAARAHWGWNATAASKKIKFESNRATDGFWEMTTGFTTLAEWHGLVLTYDGTSTSNDPILYTLDSQGFQTLTVGSGLTEGAAPSGTEGADGVVLYAGNSSTTGRTFDGLIGEFAIWASKLLSADEAKAVLYNGAMTIPGMYLYWPFDSQTVGGSTGAPDYSGNGWSGAIVGATLGANPPIRPAGRRG